MNSHNYLTNAHILEDKIYVQHRLLENSSLVWDLLAHKKGWCYIAGYVKYFVSSRT